MASLSGPAESTGGSTTTVTMEATATAAPAPQTTHVLRLKVGDDANYERSPSGAALRSRRPPARPPPSLAAVHAHAHALAGRSAAADGRAA